MNPDKPPKIPPKPGKDTVYIDVDDEITAIIDKVEGAKEKVVALVLPKRAAVLQSLVNMKLLQRSAEKAAKNVVLITSEDILLPLAGVVGLHVAKNLQSKPEIPAHPVKITAKDVPEDQPESDIDTSEEEPATKLDYHRTIGELAAGQAVEDDESIDLADEDEEQADKPKEKKSKAPKNKGPKVPNFDRFRLMIAGIAVLFIGLIVFIVLAIFVLPKATITIQTESIPVSANLTPTAATTVKTLDEAGNNIPATLETKQQTSTQQVTATGQQNNGTKATGSVTMAATQCAPDLGPPDDVGAGTGISENGLTYITQQDASFNFSGTDGHNCNYYKSNSVNITAQQGGAKYNTSLSGASVSGASSITATGSASGGTDNVITVVSQTDLNSAKSGITQADTDAFTKAFESALSSQGFYVLTSTLKASDPAQTANPALGAQATTTTVTTQITYTVLVVKKSDLTSYISDALTKQIDKTKQKLSSTNVINDATITVQSQSAPTSASLSISENTSAVPILDIANIKKQAVGQKTADIQSAISGLPGVKSVNVDLSPFWVSKAPKASKITVVQKQVTGSGS